MRALLALASSIASGTALAFRWAALAALLAPLVAYVFLDRALALLVPWLLRRRFGFAVRVEWISLRMPGFPGDLEVCVSDSY